MIYHVFNGAQFHPRFQRPFDIDQENRHTFGFLFDLIQRRGARQKDHVIGMAHTADPNLLPVDHITIAFANGRGFDLSRIRSRCGFRHPHGL